MGYVGQPLALRYANLGYKVLGLDIDAVKGSDFSNNNGFCQFWYIAPSVL
jgi:UDP-N-acetyl-D-glucosamine dehydrogenase